MLARRWSSIVRGSVGGSNDFLNTPPPRHVLYALTQSCRGSTKQSSRRGLLSAVGYTNLVNVSKLVQSPPVQKGIEEGKKVVVGEVKKLNVSSKLPNPSDLEAAKSGLKEAIDSLNLTALINSTNSTLLNTTEIETLIAKLNNFTATNYTSNFSRGIAALNDTVVQVNKLKPQMNATRIQLENVSQQKDNILSPVEELIGAFNATISVSWHSNFCKYFSWRFL
ncbi:unnamed protein product [Mesocestoides corti]|uniref:Uncharacterized protein n=1 Tax=Mesocestoides corti TaxID=53468 RepID=A0A3P6HT39_MESCO|nr:unnamed protein product [Mesocestoides corti]